MKKTIIGAALLITGTIQLIGIMICGSINISNLYLGNSYAIPAHKLRISIFNINQLNLSIVFGVAIAFCLAGLIIIIREFCRKGSS